MEPVKYDKKKRLAGTKSNTLDANVGEYDDPEYCRALLDQTDLTPTVTVDGFGRVTLEWAAIDEELDLISYHIYVTDENGELQHVIATKDTSYRLPQQFTSGDYTFAIVAEIDVNHESMYSDEYAADESIDASVFVSDGVEYTLNEDGTCTVTAVVDSSLESIVIPQYVDGHKVSAVGSGAFDGSSATEVELPVTIEDIADDAFDGLDSSATLTAPEHSYAAQWIEENWVHEEATFGQVDCTADDEDLVVGHEVTFEGQAYNATSVVVSIDEEIVDTVTPDDDGVFTFAFTPDEAGTYAVKFVAYNDDFEGESEIVTVTVAEEEPVTGTPSVTAATLEKEDDLDLIVGSDVTFKVTTSGADSVKVYIDNELVKTVTVTDGENTITWTPEDAGDYTVKLVPCSGTTEGTAYTMSDTVAVAN